MDLTKRDIAAGGYRSPDPCTLPGPLPDPLVPPDPFEVHRHGLESFLDLGLQQIGSCLPEGLVSLETLFLGRAQTLKGCLGSSPKGFQGRRSHPERGA